MKKNVLFSLFIGVFIFASCQKDPIADFDVSKSVAEINEPISFTNSSEEAESFEWEFGDGVTSTSENPTHSYSTSGTYTVTLTSYSKKEKKMDKASAIITINAVPTKMVLNEVIVTRFPATESNGAGWDLTSGPDIYPYISFNGVTVWGSNIYFQDADQLSNYVFDVNPTIDLTAITSQYSIDLYDYDDIGSDWMGGINFTPYTAGNGLPTTIYLDAGGAVAFELSVSYVY